MAGDSPEKGDGDNFDVVMMHAPTDDGQGAQVLRARPGRLEAGEVRPVRDGKPLMPGGEVVRLSRRKDAPALYDVQVDHVIPGKTPAALPSSGGPAQVATKAYRESWERTFRPAERKELN